LQARAYVYIENEDEMRELEVKRFQTIIDQQRSSILTLSDTLRNLAQKQQASGSTHSS